MVYLVDKDHVVGNDHVVDKDHVVDNNEGSAISQSIQAVVYQKARA